MGARQDRLQGALLPAGRDLPGGRGLHLEVDDGPELRRDQRRPRPRRGPPGAALAVETRTSRSGRWCSSTSGSGSGTSWSIFPRTSRPSTRATTRPRPSTARAPGPASRAITLPLLRAAIVLSVILAVVNFLKAFALVFVMTQGGPAGRTELMATYVYREAFGTGQLRFGFSAAASIVLFAMIMACHGARQPGRPRRRGGAVTAPRSGWTRRRGPGRRVRDRSVRRRWRWRSPSTGWS